LHHPELWSITISNVTWKGVATMDPGYYLTVSAVWYMEGATIANLYTFSVNSVDLDEKGSRFVNSATVPAEERVYSP
jgi:hypothetical protein